MVKAALEYGALALVAGMQTPAEPVRLGRVPRIVAALLALDLGWEQQR